MPQPVRNEPEFVRMGTGPANGNINHLAAVKVNSDGTVSVWQPHEDPAKIIGYVISSASIQNIVTER